MAAGLGDLAAAVGLLGNWGKPDPPIAGLGFRVQGLGLLNGPSLRNTLYIYSRIRKCMTVSWPTCSRFMDRESRARTC